MATPRLPGPRNTRLFRTSFEASPDMRHMVRDIQMDTDELIGVVFEEVRRDLLRFVKGYTNVSRPGDYRAQFGPLFRGKKGPDRNKVEWKDFVNWWKIPRPAHPGGWADITEELKNSYVATVTRLGPADYVLSLDNTAPHAKFVEAKDGFFVVEGVFTPGGYVEHSIRKTFDFLSKRFTKGPRGGRRLSTPTTEVTNPDGTGVRVTGV